MNGIPRKFSDPGRLRRASSVQQRVRVRVRVLLMRHTVDLYKSECKSSIVHTFILPAPPLPRSMQYDDPFNQSTFEGTRRYVYCELIEQQ